MTGFDDIKSKTAGFFTSAGEGAKKAGSAIANSASELTHKVESKFHSSKSTDVPTESTGTKVSEAAKEAGTKIADAAGSVGTGIKEGAEAVGSSVKSGAESAGAGIKSAAETVSSKFH